MFCPKCGNQIPPNSQFCNACGAAVSALPAAAPAQAYPPPPAYYPPQPAYYPPPQGQPAYAPPMQAPMPQAQTGAGILGRLPVLGGIAVGAGFFMLWDTQSSMSGWDFLKFGFEQIPNLDASSSYYGQQVVTVIFAILFVLILIAALLGLLSLTGSKGVRSSAAVFSMLGLVDLLSFYTFVVIVANISLESLVSSTGFGWYLVVGGLLWMIFTPLFAPKPQPVFYNPYMPKY